MAVQRSDLQRSDEELLEWVAAMESVLRTDGPDRAKILFRAVRDYLTDVHVIVEDATLNTPIEIPSPWNNSPPIPATLRLSNG